MNICIGREFGSGGHEISAYLAEHMDLPLYDEEFIDQALVSSGLSILEIQRVNEQEENPFLHRVWYDFPDRNLRGLSSHQITAKQQSEFILEAAGQGDCIFVGRCADHILKQAGIPRVSIFVSAPFEDRVCRKVRLLGQDKDTVTSLVRKKDYQRRKYYNIQTGLSWGIPSSYDLCVNSSTLGIPKTAATILLFLESRMGAQRTCRMTAEGIAQDVPLDGKGRTGT